MSERHPTSEERFRLLAGVALADGVLSPGETQLLLEFACRLELGRQRAGRILNQLRIDGRVRLDPAADLDDAVFGDLIQMVFADGRASASEMSYLRSLAKHCGFARGRVDELLAESMLSTTTGQAKASGRQERAPRVVGNYEVGEELGRGAAGVVYHATHRLLGREVALKLFPICKKSGQARRSGFLREVRAAAKLSHPNILPTLDAGEAEGLPYLVMELVPGGETFQHRLEREGPFDSQEAARAIAAVARAVHYAHGEGLLHRDLKPGNVLVPEDGEPRLGDFGLVSEVGEAATRGRLVGTPAYMSPEQLRTEDLDPKSDIYSLGATLYTLLTGEPPFLADGLVELSVRVLQDTPEEPSRRRADIRPGVEALCMRCLAKEPAERPGADELAEGLERGPRLLHGQDLAPLPAQERLISPRPRESCSAPGEARTRPGCPRARGRGAA